MRRVEVKVNDVVVVNKDHEVMPLAFVEEGNVGRVLDVTFPNYCKVKLTNGMVYWIDSKYLDVVVD